MTDPAFEELLEGDVVQEPGIFDEIQEKFDDIIGKNSVNAEYIDKIATKVYEMGASRGGPLFTKDDLYDNFMEWFCLKLWERLRKKYYLPLPMPRNATHYHNSYYRVLKSRLFATKNLEEQYVLLLEIIEYFSNEVFEIPSYEEYAKSRSPDYLKGLGDLALIYATKFNEIERSLFEKLYSLIDFEALTAECLEMSKTEDFQFLGRFVSKLVGSNLDITPDAARDAIEKVFQGPARPSTPESN